MGEEKGDDPPSTPAGGTGQGDEASVKKIKLLKEAVVQATMSCGGEGNSVATLALVEMVRENPSLLPDTILCVKSRVKAKDEQVSIISMSLVDVLIDAFGLPCSRIAMGTLLPRISRLAAPGTLTPATVRHRAQELVRKWGASLGTSEGGEGFAAAERDLRLLEEEESARIRVQQGRTYVVDDGFA
eukprot:CAMPEP_0169428466 /NCGR_PEP_ID=MMETSP1042-20121227/1341_1 /TAXON_ID=464988 /ORGANISM="Hemiselmis andersenii, Strain CCMP1180" /LENGTH=185 /DNA_ID=CAMNT_0009538637 /DNA_START=78 /DNA_END=632 /DNA_ORIENTATION=-